MKNRLHTIVAAFALAVTPLWGWSSNASLDELRSACRDANNAEYSGELLKAMTRMQEYANNSGGVVNDNRFNNYVGLLSKRLSILQKSEIKVKHLESEMNKEMELSVNLNVEIAKLPVGCDARVKLEAKLKDIETKMENIKLEINQNRITETDEDIRKRSEAYGAVVKLIDENSQENILKTEREVFDYIKRSIDPEQTLFSRKYITNTGKDVLVKFRQDTTLNAWLSKADFKEKRRKGGRIEMVYKFGADEWVSIIFFEENNVIKFHDIWIKKGTLGRYKDVYLSAE